MSAATVCARRGVDPAYRAEVEFPREAASVPDARAWIRDTLTGWGVPKQVVTAAVLAISEIATNAVIHTRAAGPMTVYAAFWDGRVRIAVGDPGRDCKPVRPCRASATSNHGRGLAIVQELTGEFGGDFGCEPTVFGKSVFGTFNFGRTP